MNVNVVGVVKIPIIDLIETGKNIKKLLAKNNMTVKDIQMNLGFTTPYPVYKWINGYITSGLVLVAIILGVLSLYYNKSVADALFSHVSDLQYVSININNINPYCLLHN